jgi:hypothetical protein
MKINQASSKVITQKTHAGKVSQTSKSQTQESAVVKTTGQITERQQSDFLDSIGMLKSELNQEIVNSMVKHQLPLSRENFQMIHQTLGEMFSLNENFGQFENLNLSETLNQLIQDLATAIENNLPDANVLPNLLSDTKQLTSVLSFLSKHDLPLSLDNMKFAMDVLNNNLSMHNEFNQIQEALLDLKLPQAALDVSRLLEQIDQSIIKPESHLGEIFKEVTERVEQVLSQMPRDGENAQALNRLEGLLNNLKNIEQINQNLLYFNTPIHLNNELNHFELLSDQHNNQKGTSKNQKFQFTLATHNLGDVQCSINPRDKHLFVNIKVQDEDIQKYMREKVLELHKTLKHLPYETISININNDEFHSLDEFLDQVDTKNKYKLNIRI